MSYPETINGMVVVGIQKDQDPNLSQAVYELQAILQNAGITTEWRDGEVPAKGYLVISPADYIKAKSLGLLRRGLQTAKEECQRHGTDLQPQEHLEFSDTHKDAILKRDMVTLGFTDYE